MSTPVTLQEYLQPSRFIDSQQAGIVALAATLTGGVQSDVEQAVALYYWARDQVRYNPYALSGEPDAFLASTTLAAREGW